MVLCWGLVRVDSSSFVSIFPIKKSINKDWNSLPINKNRSNNINSNNRKKDTQSSKREIICNRNRNQPENSEFDKFGEKKSKQQFVVHLFGLSVYESIIRHQESKFQCHCASSSTDLCLRHKIQSSNKFGCIRIVCCPITNNRIIISRK